MGQWLSQQHQMKAGNDDDEPLKLVETWKVDHVQIREDNKRMPQIDSQYQTLEQ